MRKRPRLHCFENVRHGSTVAARVRIADDKTPGGHGLLRTTSLHDDAGLWLLGRELIHTFGMTQTIDAVFLDENLRVCGLRRHLRPSRVAFSWRAHSVLQLSAGTIARSGTKIGDQLARRSRSKSASAAHQV